MPDGTLSIGTPTITIQGSPRMLRAFSLTEHELDHLATSRTSTHSGFLGICVGALVSFGIVLSTVKIDDPKLFATFTSLFGLAALLSAYFGIRSYTDASAARKRLEDLKGSGPSGSGR